MTVLGKLRITKTIRGTKRRRKTLFQASASKIGISTIFLAQGMRGSPHFFYRGRLLMCFRNSVGFLFVNRKIEKAGHKTQSVNVTEILDFHQKIDSAVVTAVTAETVAFPKLVGIRETVNSRAPWTFQVFGFEDRFIRTGGQKNTFVVALGTRKNGIHRALANTKFVGSKFHRMFPFKENSTSRSVPEFWRTRRFAKKREIFEGW